MNHLTYVTLITAVDIAAGAYDAHETLVGLNKKSGLESNGVVDALAKVLPETAALIVYNVVKTAAFASLSLIHNPVALGGSIAALIADIAGHIQGGLKWRYLNNGGQINRATAYTWWQKLLGMGWD